MAELVDAHDSKSCGAIHESSILSPGTVIHHKAQAITKLLQRIEKVLPNFRTILMVRKWETCTGPVRTDSLSRHHLIARAI